MTPKYYLIHFVFKYKYRVAVLVIIIILIYGRFHEDLPNINSNYEQIDVVYTWVNGSDTKFLEKMQTFLAKSTIKSVDSSPQRFDDKYELKFSLRSLEKYAPWIRHVFIVTNGQIPYWLNLDCEKLTLITHEEIFRDLSDLPTFSSPAIEAHLHRIPGLSKRFIYMNDDIFFGSPIYPEDFLTLNGGYLIYLTWPVPPCASDCPWMYVNDEQCDSQCFNENCQFDGDDCNSQEKDETGMLKTDDVTVANKFNFTAVTLSNLTDAILDHNKKVMLLNKWKRRKYRSQRTKNFDYHNEQIKSVDAFGDSLQTTNRLLNKRYEYRTRYVAAHAPILIDLHIMHEMQMKFAKEFARTSRNRFRSGEDLQFSFAYYYYLIHERINVDLGEIFDKFDTDKSWTWSDREIRTVLTKLYELPLSYAIVDHFEVLLTNCTMYGGNVEVTTPEFERYIDSKLPIISRHLVLNCPTLNEILRGQFGLKPKFKYTLINNAHSGPVTFKMLNSNISEVVGHLDEIRRRTTKFVCLNDNLETGKDEENDLIKSVLYDFYLSLFPLQSRFELPNEFRNRFLHVNELKEWKRYHFQLKLVLCIIFLLFLYICTFKFYRKRSIFNKFI